MENATPQRKPKVRPERVQGPMDLPFLALVILLLTIGIIMMFSASYAMALQYEANSTHYLVSQTTVGVVGIAVMLFLSRVNYQWFRALSLPAIGVAILLLLIILIPGVGITRNRATRWFMLFGITIQPSEIAKLAVIMCFASMISVYKEKMKTFKYGIVPFVVILGVISALLALEPHFSAIILIVAVGGAMMFMGGVHWGWFTAAGAAGIAGIAYMLTQGAHSSVRLQTWLNPWAASSAEGYQIIQSLYAVGSGGLLGVGIGQSRQKYLYLPEVQNDFVFAVVCEELGYVGALLIMLLFALLILRGYWIALKARDRFGSLLAGGVTTLFALQVFLNIAVVTNLIPTTGVSLPFFSSGGSSLLIQLVEMGIVLSVSRQIPAPKSG